MLVRVGQYNIDNVLPDLVPFVQFIKHEKHPWRSVTLNKVTLLHGCFSRFLNCTNSAKSRNASLMDIIHKPEYGFFLTIVPLFQTPYFHN